MDSTASKSETTGSSLDHVCRQDMDVGSYQADPSARQAAPGSFIDSNALDEAYPRILRYVRSIVRDQGEAEDLAQETFLRAYRARDTLRDAEAQLSWLYRIATHVCVDRLRQRARRPVESDTALEDADPPDAGPALQHLIERDEMSVCVQDYLGDLPDGYRAVILLHDLHELTGPEIADLLDLSLATVKIRLHRARHKLRAALEAG